jgi:YfiH family protein
MFLRVKTASSLVYYESSLLKATGVRHAFSTRLGGLSPAPFDSMNLGNPNGCDIQDDYDRIWENYNLLQAAAGCSVGQPCRVHQVHGAEVARVRRGEEFDTSTKADALVSDDASWVLSVRVADCVPVLLASVDGTRVAAIHAGWRGVVAGVVPAALRELAGEQSPRNYVAAIGPCIGFDAFEVGQEVMQEFARVFGPDAPCRPCPLGRPGKGYADLREGVHRQLVAAGIPPTRIDVSDRCTYRDRDEFFSHRRDNGVTGRMAAVIQARRS